MTGAPRLAFLGFGEAATEFSRGLSGAGFVDLAAYDVAIHGGRGEALLRDRAAQTGTRLLTDREAFGEADVIFAMVQPSVAGVAAEETAPFMRPGAWYVDFSSAAPSVKQAAAGVIEAAGAGYVDAGIIGSVPTSGYRVPIIMSGIGAAGIAATFTPFGMKIDVVGTTVGAAAGIKLVRSILAKGMEALYAEALLVARRTGVSDEVLDSFCAFLDARPAHDTAGILVRSHVIHAARRADEVAMSRDMVLEAGVSPHMTDAIISVMKATAATGIAQTLGGQQPSDLDAALDAMDAALAANPSTNRTRRDS
ncbi:MAG: DUF1932 domain-containing protein [Jhaorihella sp.]